MRVIIVAIIMLINVVFQSTALQGISINNVTPNIIVITIVSFAILRGKKEGMIIGLLFGITQDILFGTVLGFYTLMYFYLGFLCGYLHLTFYRESVMIPLMIIGMSDFAVNFIIYFLTFLLRGRLDLTFYMIHTILPEVTYTTLAGVLLYRFYLFVNQRLELHESDEGDADTL